MAKDQSSLEQDKATLRAMVAMGCDREMAAKAIGWSVPQLNDVLREDPQFAGVLLRAEGQAEFHRMRAVHDATKDEKNWRAATWWLERRAHKRYDRHSRRNITSDEITEFIAALVEIVFADVTRESDRERMVTSLLALASQWEDMVNSQQPLRLESDEPKEGENA